MVVEIGCRAEVELLGRESTEWCVVYGVHGILIP